MSAAMEKTTTTKTEFTSKPWRASVFFGLVFVLCCCCTVARLLAFFLHLVAKLIAIEEWTCWMKISLCAPTICQSNPYLTTKISTLQIKVWSDLVVWYNFWENMPSCLTFGSLVAATAAAAVAAAIFAWRWFRWENQSIYAFAYSPVLVHITICWNCPFTRLFMWGCACLWNEMFLCDVLRNYEWRLSFFFFSLAATWKTTRAKVWRKRGWGNGGGAQNRQIASQCEERKREIPICIRCVRNNLQIMLHLISCCFGCCFFWAWVYAKTHSHAFRNFCCRLMDRERAVQIVKGWDWMGFGWRTLTHTHTHDMTFNRL